MQYASRREARAAEAALAAIQVGSEVAVIPATSHEIVAVEPAIIAAPVAEQLVSEAAAIPAPPASLSVSIESHPVVPPRARAPRAAAARPVVRAAASTSSSSQHRKNPLSVLATMAVVGGLFAVAGLPAYAVSTTDPVTQAAPAVAGVAQSVAVTSNITSETPIRDLFTATTPEDLAESNADAVRAAANEAYLASGARELGDDYPWPFELTDDQGGGLSPLNYYYRECVDFVAWRLNRDAGSYSAPFKYVWSNLTPNGGDGSQWMSNWLALGRTVSNTPIAGSVAYTGANHVAYVKSANADGTVTLEEYNWIPGAYSTRTIPASSVVAFLYPPG